MPSRFTLFTGFFFLATSSVVFADEPVSFNRDIRPIFSDTCFKCHGPDSAARKADLRLDTEQGAFTPRDGVAPFVPGKPDRSGGYLRIVTDDPDELMPPPDSHLSITPAQKKLIRKWIEQGAKYEKHWSLIPAKRPAPPVVKGDQWSRNPMDRFILARLKAEGLHPSVEAEKQTLIRRLYLDLLGVPPTLPELDAAMADLSPEWYERLVDRLLDSPTFGERMARPWLDASRYADTNGYQVDTARDMWLWREWVIDAHNRNLPFDRFTVEQIAGDLLPNPTVEQQIASGFNRNHRINGEGGIIPEEFIVEYVVDRVDTTGTVFMGLTLGCARCHDHKFDPVTQREFYQLYAFFHNVPESGVDGLVGPSKPFLKVPTPEQKAKLDAMVAEWTAIKKSMNDAEQKLAAAQPEWEQSQVGAPVALPSEGLVTALTLDAPPDAAGISPAWSFKEGAPAFIASPFGKAADFDGQRFIDAGDLGNFDRDQPFSLGAWLYTHPDTSGAAIARMDDAGGYRGYNLFIANGTVIVQIISAFPGDYIQLSTPAVVKPGQWQHVLATYDGSGAATGIKVYVDGALVQGTPTAPKLMGTTRNSVPLTLATRTPGSRFKGAIDEARIYSRALAPDEVKALATSHLISSILATPAAQRTPEQTNTLREHYLSYHSPEEYRRDRQRAQMLEAERKTLENSFPTTMVMVETDQPKDTFMLVRGEYDKLGEKVIAAVPAAMPPLPADAPANRLSLARWLVSGDHPLTARVAVNRLWQNFFGEGLVRTAEDFGSQGQWPSHPELLDWLATEYPRIGWDTKAMVRMMVTSSTYRQSSRVTPELLERDPANRLLARGPRFRMPAEMIRDNALFISGLLVEKLGGPSVKPYQPAKLWEELTSGGFSANAYEQDKGEKLYRRGLYTYWKRTIPPPSMAIFDAPSREVCVVRRQRTNTPLQALALMNDTIYVEAARHLASRMIREGGSTPKDRIHYAFRLAACRSPDARESTVLRSALERSLAEFRAQPSEAEKLLTVGESPRDPSLDTAEHAAYTAIANLILNLDETITRE